MMAHGPTSRLLRRPGRLHYLRAWSVRLAVRRERRGSGIAPDTPRRARLYCTPPTRPLSAHRADTRRMRHKGGRGEALDCSRDVPLPSHSRPGGICNRLNRSGNPIIPFAESLPVNASRARLAARTLPLARPVRFQSRNSIQRGLLLRPSDPKEPRTSAPTAVAGPTETNPCQTPIPTCDGAGHQATHQGIRKVRLGNVCGTRCSSP